MDELARIKSLIYEIRGVKVMLDKDLAELYHVTTGNLNKAVKRNIRRFPSDFMFQLNKTEFEQMKSDLIFQNGTSSWGGTRKLPYAFTEQGLAMLSGSSLPVLCHYFKDLVSLIKSRLSSQTTGLYYILESCHRWAYCFYRPHKVSDTAISRCQIGTLNKGRGSITQGRFFCYLNNANKRTVPVLLGYRKMRHPISLRWG